MYLGKGEPKRLTDVYLCDGITDDFYFLCFDYLNFLKRFYHEHLFLLESGESKKKKMVSRCSRFPIYNVLLSIKKINILLPGTF